MKSVRAWLTGRVDRQASVAVLGMVLVLIALNLVFAGESWTLTATLALMWLLMVGVALVISRSIPAERRRRLWLALGPGLALLGAGVLVPDWAVFFTGGGLGWIVAAQFVLRNRVRMEYQAAIKHLRRNDYDAALAAMEPLIAAEPRAPEHRRFRAELYRLAGNLRRAAAEYEQVVALAPASAAGYTGLAEVYAQQGAYERAREYGEAAYARDARNWMVAYNLGLIADRQGDSAAAIDFLQACERRLPAPRYRALANLWLARNFARLGADSAAQTRIERLRRTERGLQQWQVVFQSEQAGPLRAMLADDVALAQAVLASDAPLALLRRDG